MAGSLWEALAGRAPGQPTGPAEPGLYDAVIERLNPARARPRLRDGIEEAPLVSLRGSPYVMLRSPDGAAPAYLRLEPAELELARRMDGSRTVAALVAEFARLTGELAPARVVRVVADLASNRMLEELPVDAFRPLRSVRRRGALGRLRDSVVGVLRGRRFALFGIDPLVGFLYRAGGRLLFTRVGGLVVAAVALLGLGAFALRWVRGTEPVFSVGGSVALGAAALLLLNAVCLVAHELGHALAAKHAGRRVPSAGVLLYFGIPSVFVDTSDVWMAGRRARLLTSASGPLAAVFLAGALNLAAFAVPELGPAALKLGFLWYLNVVFNLNPLLALDGYYLLMDWLELPNLRARGLALTIRRLRRRRFGWGGLIGDERLYGMYGTVVVLWLVVTLGLGIRLWRDRLDSLGTTLWRDGLGGQAGFVLILALLLAPLLGTAAGRVGAALAARRSRRRLLPGAALDEKLAALRASSVGRLPDAGLRAVAEASTWMAMPVGSTVPSDTTAVVDRGALDAWSAVDGRDRVTRRALAGDLVTTEPRGDAVRWRSRGARLLALPAGAEIGAAVAADDEARIVAAAAALAAGAAGAAGAGPRGVHPEGDATPVLGREDLVEELSAETEESIRRRARRLVLLLALLALLSLLVAVPSGLAWSEVPGDRVLVTVERGSARIVRDGAGPLVLAAPERVVVRRGTAIEVDVESLVRLTFRGGAEARLCGGSHATLGAASSSGGEPVRPAARLALERGALFADTASATDGHDALRLTIMAARVIESRDAAVFGVRGSTVEVVTGSVLADGAPVEVGGDVACPGAPGDPSGPEPTAPPASGTPTPGAGSPEPSTAPTPTATPSPSASVPSLTPSPAPTPSSTATSGPTPGPTPQITPTPAPTPIPTPAPTPIPTPTPAPDFTIDCTNTTLPNPMSSWSSDCTITSLNGFSAPVTLDCAFNPAQLSAAIICSFNPAAPVVPPPNGSVTVTVFMTVTPPGCYEFDVTATSGSLAHRVRFACP